MKETPTDDPLFGKGSDPRRRPQDPPGVSRRGEEARRVEGTVGLLQGPRDDPGGPGVPSAEGRRLPAGEIADARSPPDACASCSVSPRAGRAAAGRAGVRTHDANPATDATLSDRTLRHPGAGPVRPAADRAHQRRVLRDAEPRARRHLRPAQHHQLHARRAVHDGRVLRVVPARALGCRLLVVAAARAAARRRDRRRHRADDAVAALQARPPVRAPADVRPGAHHPGRVHQLLRQLRPAVPAARGVRRRRSTSGSCSCRSIARG